MTIITGPTQIENVRRLTIRHALKLKDEHGMWPNLHWQRNCLPTIRRLYGWEGRTVKQARKFMDELGAAE